MIDALLEVICRTTGMGFAAVAYVNQQQWIACAVRDEINFGLLPGGELEVETTFCYQVMNNKELIVIDDVSKDLLYAHHPTPAMYGFQSYISVPIHLKNGEFFGTLCAIHPTPTSVQTPEILQMFALYAELISAQLSTDEQLERMEETLSQERKVAIEHFNRGETLSHSNLELSLINQALIKTNLELARVNQELKAATYKIEEREIALRLAIDAARFGTWFIHSVTREFITDARLKELFGYYPEETLTIEQALAQITEEYRELVSETLEKAIYHNGDYDISYPVVGLHDGRLRWLRAIGNLTADPSGTFSAFTGVVMDISEQVESRQKIQNAYEQLRLSKEAAQLGFFDMDLLKGTMEWDPRCRELFGINHHQKVSYEEDFVKGLHDDDRERILTIIENVFIKSISGGVYDVEYRTVGAEDGQIRWVKAKGQAYFNEEEQATRFIGSVLDITEQKLDDLRKNDFISMVSHELKTPITSLKAYVQILEKKAQKIGDEFGVTAFHKMNAQVNKMIALINGFLNLSHLDANKIHLNLQNFDMNELIFEVIEETKLLSPAHQFYVAPSSNAMLTADRNKIEQVLVNLFSNAIKYSPEGKPITIGIECKANEVLVSVKDEGFGINKDDLNHLFDRYFRVKNQYTQNIAGFGIGLYLCAEIIKRHHGEIWVESSIGEGATFYFTLPLNLN